VVEVGTSYPEPGGGLLGPSGVSAAARSARSSRRQTWSTWSGWCSVPSGFALRSTSRPRSTNRRTTNAVTFAFSPITFGVPSASAIRSAAAPPLIGGEGIAARKASASSASTAARDHRDDDTSGAGMRPVWRAHRKAAAGTLQALGGLARVVLGSSHEITSRSFARSGEQNMARSMKGCQS
jgi:hypothetical protein